MRKVLILISLIFWYLFTLLLAVSILGMVVLVREDHSCRNFQGESGESVWFRIGKKLVDELVEKK